MHEEPYAQAMLDLALSASGGRTITRIHLGVGRFSAIVPDSLAVFFTHLSRGSAAESAELVFKTIPVVLTCRACGEDRTLDIPENVPVRPALAKYLSTGCHCGSSDLKVTGGLGLDLISVDVDE
ncbi:MAG: hydrogenase maturation nickel metallochaperone HypA [Desulfobacterales bacterium]|nr:hydrogenase maturation nickel metallochaperone HypA [Desulfobacterales bacterium]